MGLFYAFLKYEDEEDGDYHCSIERPYLVTFPNREAADEWWRLISTPPSPYSKHVKRISPQLYTHEHHYRGMVLYCTSTQFPEARMLHKRILVLSLNNPITITPIVITDYISGKWYFIRSKADPSSYWYLRIKGACLVCGETDCDAIHVSTEYRSKFCVQVRPTINGPQVPDNFVMIGRDEIVITARKDYTVYINDEGELKATKGYQFGGADLLFSDIKDKFVTHSEKKVNGEVWEYVESVERGSGEAWELVD